ncbi:MAG: hypothetical protein ABIH10_01015 [Spirochaetota bacterium]
MENKKPIETAEPHSPFIRSFFFWSGIIATIAYRIIFVLNIYSQYWVNVAWYIGTAGFVIYFWHRFDISKKKVKLIKYHNLVETVEKCDNIDGDKKKALLYLVKTNLTSKERWNSAFIFAISLVALIVSISIDVYNFIK